MGLKNCMEDIVEKYVDSVMEESEMCLCDKCRLDVMAIALNNLPASYVVTDEGNLYSKVRMMEVQFDVTVLAELTKACQVVKNGRRDGH